jgi:hypothetical protein
MLESLYEVSATLALGGFFLFGLLVIVEVGKKEVISTFLNTYQIPKFFATWLGFSLTFISGVFLEEMSDRAVERLPFLFQPLGVEERIKAHAILETRGLDSRLRAHRAYRRYAPCVLNDEEVKRIEKYLDSEPGATLAEFSEFDQTRIEHLVANLFYEAKNTVYQEATYFEELSEIERRIKFLRGFALACFLLFFFIVVVGSIRALTKKRKLFSVTIPAAILLLILFLAARYTYTKQEEGYTKRIFGYFLVIDKNMSPFMNPNIENKATIEPSGIKKQNFQNVKK